MLGIEFYKSYLTVTHCVGFYAIVQNMLFKRSKHSIVFRAISILIVQVFFVSNLAFAIEKPTDYTLAVASQLWQKRLQQEAALRQIAEMREKYRRLGISEYTTEKDIDEFKKDAGSLLWEAQEQASVSVAQKATRSFVGGEDRFWLRYPERLVDMLNKDSRKRDDTVLIVDLGTATGSITIWAVQQNPKFRLLGLEKDPGFVEKAIEKARKESLCVLEVESSTDFVKILRSSEKPALVFNVTDVTAGLPLEDKSVDAIIMHRLRDSIKKPSERNKLTDELCRILKPEGWLSLVEDLYITPQDPEGDWYETRYQISEIIVQHLVDEDRLPAFYGDLLKNPHYRLMLSLRDVKGEKIDETVFSGKEGALITEIRQGRLNIRGIGVHETQEHIVDSFEERGFSAHDKWRASIPEIGVREGHSTVMKGILFQKTSTPKPKQYSSENERTHGITFDDQVKLLKADEEKSLDFIALGKNDYSQ